MQSQPYYSFVVTSRNDFHGGNILKRMRLFMSGLMAQAERHRLPIELVFVEWNPPADRPRLRDVLPNPKTGDYLTVRYIEVPESIHQQYKLAKEIPLFQMIAKNVGIRRARGQFICCTNIDLLFSDALMARLVVQDLDPKCYYRANRVDFPDGIEESMPLDAQLAYARAHVIRVNGWDSRFKYVDARRLGMQEMLPISRKIVDRIAKRHRSKQPAGEGAFYLLDREACGDFTLMHRDAWADIQGYAELDLYSIHVDTLAIAAAWAIGYTQVVWPSAACTYHIDHPSGWSSMGPLEKLKFSAARPGVDYAIMQEVAFYLLKTHERFSVNHATWGFVDEAFEEVTLGGMQV
jgi:hypothetical protein